MRHGGNPGKQVRTSKPHTPPSFIDDAESLGPRSNLERTTSSSTHSSVSRQPSPAPLITSSHAVRVQTRTRRPEAPAAATRSSQLEVPKATQRGLGPHSSPTKRQARASATAAPHIITTRSRARETQPSALHHLDHSVDDEYQSKDDRSNDDARRSHPLHRRGQNELDHMIHGRQRPRQQEPTAMRRVHTRSQRHHSGHDEVGDESPTLTHLPEQPALPGSAAGVVTRSMARKLKEQDLPEPPLASGRERPRMLKHTISSLSASTAASDETAPLSAAASGSQEAASTPPLRKQPSTAPSEDASSFPRLDDDNGGAFDTPENHFRHVRRSPQFNYDRFIPARSPDLGSDLRMYDHGQRPSSPVFSRRTANIEHRIHMDEANRTYDALLRSELLNDRSAADDFEQSRRLRSSSPPPSQSAPRRDIYRLSSSPNQLPSLVPWSSSAASGGPGSSSRPATPTPSSPNRAQPVFIYKSPRKSGIGMASSLPAVSPPSGRNLFGRASPVHEVYQQSKLTKGARRILSPRQSHRKIPKEPVKVLDAPGICDDYYLNLMDWSSTNQVAVALASEVYVWDAQSSQTNRLCDVNAEGNGDNKVTSVRWAENGKHLAVGLNTGAVQIWDASHGRKVRSYNVHTRRVGVVEWNQSVVTTGSRDKRIYNHDSRARESSVISTYYSHEQEVCGLRWSPDKTQLASGGNDNLLLIWDTRYTPLESLVPSYHPEIASVARTFRQPLFRLRDHTAAVKALAWSPTQRGLLASGGGTDDRCIRIWNTLTGQQISCTDTKSQVCNLSWSHDGSEMVSTHGYSENHIVLWKYPSMRPFAILSGHTKRVLYLAHSPDGQTVATAAGDETIRFWEIFAKSSRLPRRPGALSSSVTRLVGIPDAHSGADKAGGSAVAAAAASGTGIMLDDLAHIR
ncbi:substrate-specific activator of APC-dependent proteolysis [Coemansia sp. RSA 1200]|nr:substrate-specific activator of APC-dependent proteolysis [Coemansia sp. RSA 1200]